MLTVSVAGVVVAVLQVLVNTARNLLPFCGASAVNESVVEVAPLMLLKLAPPSVLAERSEWDRHSPLR